MDENEDAARRSRDFARSRAKARVESLRAERLEEQARTRVIPEDLAYLSQVKALLSALNDAYAGPAGVKRLVEGIPVLCARCRRRSVMDTDYEALPSLQEALSRIGNIGIEAELFGLLEDLTVLSSETAQPALTGGRSDAG